MNTHCVSCASETGCVSRVLGRLENVIITNCCKPYVLGKSGTDFRLALVYSEEKYIVLGVTLECVSTASGSMDFIECCSVVQECLPIGLLVSDNLYGSY